MSDSGFTGNRAAQNIERNIEKVRDAQLRADVREIVGQAAGRRFLYHVIFEVCHIESLSYRGGTDTMFYEGERNVGLTLMNELIDHHSDQYMEMIQEALSDRKEELLKRREARAPKPAKPIEGDEE
jgi:hypothetical protein